LWYGVWIGSWKGNRAEAMVMVKMKRKVKIIIALMQYYI